MDVLLDRGPTLLIRGSKGVKRIFTPENQKVYRKDDKFWQKTTTGRLPLCVDIPKLSKHVVVRL